MHNILSSHKTTFFTSDLMELRVIFSSRVLTVVKSPRIPFCLEKSVNFCGSP